MSTTRIYIIRHGETDYNRRGIVQGQGVDAPLNQTGKDQARAFFERYRSVEFDRIHVSTLLRAYQTVTPFVETGIPYSIHPGLDEISWGTLEGKRIADGERRVFDEIVSSWSKGELTQAAEKGESPIQVQTRQKEFIESVLESDSGGTLLWCTHGRAMRILMCTLLNRSLRDMGDFPNQNTSLYRLEWRRGRFRLIDFHNTDHLQ